jgi:hypothetical protein
MVLSGPQLLRFNALLCDASQEAQDRAKKLDAAAEQARKVFKTSAAEHQTQVCT